MDDIKQVMKYVDHNHQDFWTSSMGDEQKTRMNKILMKNENNGLQYKLRTYYTGVLVNNTKCS
jgi:hypothetical protein